MKKFIFKIILIYILILSFSLMLVYFSGFFIILADSAYWDIFKSITIPYLLYIIYLIYSKHYRYNTHKNTYSKIKTPRSIDKNDTPIKSKTALNWIIKDQNVLFDICEVFMLITVINSFMMVISIDTPKIGEFAYIHLLMRLTIISTVMSILKGKRVLQDFKSIALALQKSNRLSAKDVTQCISNNVLQNKYRTLYVLFTTITIIICIISILFIPNPLGGVRLYLNLLIMFGVIITLIFFISIIHRLTTR